MRVTVLAPDDLVVVKGGPGDRRRFLDDALVALRTSYDPLRLELDPDRATALLANLPPGQIVITTASPLPPAAEPERIIEIASGAIVA